MDGEGVEAEESEAKGYEPVRKRGFFEIADAIDVEGDEVTGGGHGAGGLGVGGVGVVEEWGGEEGGEEDQEPETGEDQCGVTWPGTSGKRPGQNGERFRWFHEERSSTLRITDWQGDVSAEVSAVASCAVPWRSSHQLGRPRRTTSSEFSPSGSCFWCSYSGVSLRRWRTGRERCGDRAST